ncbi:MAG: 4-hydroxy-3-methylbut-2-enyl diphosphate reductase [Brumimicrobium sp.]|nr:4-hydroxy-3-methylbut-2-enyl diphosphate reductase [Brumimicrobium sp.]
MKQFDIPEFYRSPVISKVKEIRKVTDPRKKDFTPTVLDFGPVKFYIARHFGFCYGVENAIEISYRALEENKGKKIYLLSQMIHNPDVNKDLLSHGIQFLQDTEGNELISFDVLTPEDIVIIPAFGTTLEIENKLKSIGVDIQVYNTTCPFVEKVWNRSEKLGKTDHTIIIHGKHKHEETRATFSHSAKNAPSLVIKDIDEAKLLGEIILGQRNADEFYNLFQNRFTEGFDVSIHLDKLGVVNQTTMLATETQEIADFLKNTMLKKYGTEKLTEHFADTRDTLCYATNDNQSSTYGLMKTDADIAIVVGGYNSSNTTHLVELLETEYKTFFIANSSEILNRNLISHFNIHTREKEETLNFLPKSEPAKIILTSGASCPDSMVDQVLHKILSYYEEPAPLHQVLRKLEEEK